MLRLQKVYVHCCLFAKIVYIDPLLSLWLVCTFSPHFLRPWQGKSVSVSVSAGCVGDHSLISPYQDSHKVRNGFIPATTTTPTFILCFSHPHLMSYPPFLSHCFFHIETHKLRQTHRVSPLSRICRRMLTNVLLVSAGVWFQMNLYTSARNLTSIRLNSLNTHDISLLAYLLSKQA